MRYFGRLLILFGYMGLPPVCMVCPWGLARASRGPRGPPGQAGRLCRDKPFDPGGISAGGGVTRTFAEFAWGVGVRTRFLRQRRVRAFRSVPPFSLTCRDFLVSRGAGGLGGPREQPTPNARQLQKTCVIWTIILSNCCYGDTNVTKTCVTGRLASGQRFG